MGSTPRISIARRELGALKREKTIVLALLIQLFVAAFSSFLVVGLTSLYDPGSVEADAVAVGVSGETEAKLREAAASGDAVRPVSYPDRGAAMAAFEEGAVQAVLYGTTLRTVDGHRIAVEAIVPADSIRTTVVVVQLRRVLSALEATERQKRAAALDVSTLPVPEGADASPYFGFTYTVLIPLLLFLPAFISGAVAVDAVTEEIERGTLELLRVAPVSLVDIVDGKALGLILLAPVQVLIWLGLLAANGIVVGNPLVLLAYVTGIATFVVTVGIALGLATRRRRQAQLLYSTVILTVFGLAAVLPEHPATTVAKLAVSSATSSTLAHACFAVALGGAAVLAVRRYVARLPAETLS